MFIKENFTRDLIFQKFLIYLGSQEQFSKSSQKKIVCAFSGGQDSIFLVVFLIFVQAQKKNNFETFYYHHFVQIINFFSVWHALRFHYLFQSPLSIGLALYNIETENQARICRRENFERILQLTDTSILLLGHTATDKLETFLGNLQRGMGSQGITTISQKNYLENISFSIYFSSKAKNPTENCLTQAICFLNIKICFRAINDNLFSLTKKKKKKCSKKSLLFLKKKKNVNPNTRKNFYFLQNNLRKQLINKQYLIYSSYSEILFFNISLLRPFLDFHRNDISKLCNLFEFPLIADPTNEFISIYRNRLRHQIIPLAHYFYNKHFDSLLWRFLNITFYDQELCHNIYTDLLDNFLITKKEQKISQYLSNFSISLQRFLIKKIYSQSTKRQLSHYQIEIIRQILKKKY